MEKNGKKGLCGCSLCSFHLKVYFNASIFTADRREVMYLIPENL